jgi:hypothetical protein
MNSAAEDLRVNCAVPLNRRGMSRDYVDDPYAQKNFAQLKSLLDDVNVEDKGCTEKVYRGLSSRAAKPGHLSHLERPNYDFAQYINARIQT